ncbi:endonuclease III [Bifidobacterium dolichotidis]|uniref:Endonuclease III n=1 Tax=Bifidobacterium dolichotidis TaxID=2306976 RepID=A0A430FRH6_9BIFI|nr:endonuclease III [Bifidobacterium dolichotidis]RSX55476.1 endonuclease III [Bifidobacterium dolichotidis]
MARESKKARLQRMQGEYQLLCEEIPHPKCALNFETPFELLVATVLSAQCTDKRVNETTPALFKAYPTPQAMAQADVDDVENIIHSLGFYRAKARNIVMLSQDLVNEFDGQVPQDMKDLTSLPGVGRKTANVVLGNAFHVPGFPVDTHVIRVTSRLHWRDDWNDKNATPEHIEQEITACFPPSEWVDLSHRLILHGRYICKARRPLCEQCPLNQTCPSSLV